MIGKGLKRSPLFAGLALYAALSLADMNRHSATWDETHYLGLGKYLLKSGEWDVPSAILHPPLSYYLHSLPLFFCKIDLDFFEKGKGEDILAGVRRGQLLMKGSSPAGDTLLFWARLPMVGIGILLGCFVYLWARRLYGRGGGLLSLLLYCLSPNILAHSGLITPDLCVTAFGFIGLYFFWQDLRSPSIRNLVLGGVGFGLAWLSKYSGLLWLPILLVITVAEELRARRGTINPEGLRTGVPIRRCGLTVCIGLLILLLGYRFDLGPYFAGMDIQRQIAGDHFPVFLKGEVSLKGGWWYYYLFAFAVKVPVPMFILLAAVPFRYWSKVSDRKTAGLYLLFPSLAVFAAFSSMREVNIGLRYVLPAFPFLFVLAGAAALPWHRGQTAFRVGLALLSLWYGAENVLNFSHYHAYFNQFAGGPNNGYRLLVDSNLDWGQDLKELKRYVEENGIRTIKLSYFGTADPRQYGLDYEPLPSFVPLPPGRDRTPLRKGDLVAVSATNLYPLYVNLGNLADHLRSTSPMAHLGSILIYRLESAGKGNLE